MSKRKYTNYTTEFKIKVAKEYLEGPLGQRLVAKKYGINKTQVADWANLYKSGNLEGLERKNGRPSKVGTKDFDSMTKDEQIKYLLMENEILKKVQALTLKI